MAHFLFLQYHCIEATCGYTIFLWLLWFLYQTKFKRYKNVDTLNYILNKIEKLETSKIFFHRDYFCNNYIRYVIFCDFITFFGEFNSHFRDEIFHHPLKHIKTNIHHICKCEFEKHRIDPSFSNICCHST